MRDALGGEDFHKARNLTTQQITDNRNLVVRERRWESRLGEGWVVA